MSDNTQILLIKSSSLNVEVNRSSPDLNIKSDCVDNEIDFNQALIVDGEDTSQSLSKSHQSISTPSSMQHSQTHNGNIDIASTVNQPEQLLGDATLRASFKQLSRRESSLENLAEDETEAQVNASASENVVTYFVQKTVTDDDIRDFTKKTESSSRFRRTIHSLFSCCTSKSRRSQFIDKIDREVHVSDSHIDSDIEKCSNQMLATRTTDKDKEHTGLSCLRLRKFFDMLDESDTIVKRASPTRQTMSAVPYRDGDRNDTPSHKSGDNLQSENGGANLTDSDREYTTIIPESESLLNVAPFYTVRPSLLGPVKVSDQCKKCFIIDLDETLVHSSFKMVDKADFKVGVDIEGTVHTVYVLKRPYVDVFLQKMGRIFECVLFTASLAKYADPVTDFLDKWRVFRWRLFRESCVFHRGNYVKDLGMLGRPLDQIAILDNSPASYMFHPDSAVQITSWFDDPKDTALLDLIPYFEQLAQAPSVPHFLSLVKPPPKATVPVSVMLPLPSPFPAPTVTPGTTTASVLPSSTSPITSVVSAAPAADMFPAVRTSSDCAQLPSTDYDVIQLPFSRSPSPFSARFPTKSLSALPLSADLSPPGSPTRSRSEGSLCSALYTQHPTALSLPLPRKPSPLPTAHSQQSRLSRSVPDGLAALLTVQERPRQQPECPHSASSPTITEARTFSAVTLSSHRDQGSPQVHIRSLSVPLSQLLQSCSHTKSNSFHSTTTTASPQRGPH